VAEETAKLNGVSFVANAEAVAASGSASQAMDNPNSRSSGSFLRINACLKTANHFLFNVLLSASAISAPCQ